MEYDLLWHKKAKTNGKWYHGTGTYSIFLSNHLVDHYTLDAIDLVGIEETDKAVIHKLS